MTASELFTEYLIKNNLDIDTKYKKIIKCDDSTINLILSGAKSASSYPLNLYENKEDIPSEEDLTIVVNSSNCAILILRTTKSRITLFKNINYDLAKLEGTEKNLLAWQKNHIEYFTKCLEENNLKFDPNISIVFEEFEIIYKKN